MVWRERECRRVVSQVLKAGKARSSCRVMNDVCVLERGTWIGIWGCGGGSMNVVVLILLIVGMYRLGNGWRGVGFER